MRFSQPRSISKPPHSERTEPTYLYSGVPPDTASKPVESGPFLMDKKNTIIRDIFVMTRVFFFHESRRKPLAIHDANLF